MNKAHNQKLVDEIANAVMEYMRDEIHLVAAPGGEYEAVAYERIERSEIKRLIEQAMKEHEDV